MSTHSMLADVIAVFHLAFALFIVCGLVAILVGAVRGWVWVRNFWFRLIHLLMIGIVAAEAICGVPCPLTTWEFRLRKLAGEATHSRSLPSGIRLVS